MHLLTLAFLWAAFTFAAAADTRPNVVLAHADKINPDYIAVFSQSLRYHAPTAECYLFFFESPSDDVMDMLEGINVNTVVLPNFENAAAMNPMTARWLVLEQWFSPRYTDFGKVLLSDSKDVVFQADPFVWISDEDEDTLYLALEGEKIRDVDINYRWIATAFGEKAAKSVRDHTIICAGTTLGHSKAINRYIERMSEEMRRLLALDRDDVGIDQGVLNYLAYSSQLGAISLLSMKDGPIMTLQEKKEFKLDVYGRVLNDDSKVAAIVHQYNRFETLEYRYTAAYPYWRRPLRVMRNKNANEIGFSGLELLQKRKYKEAEAALKSGPVNFDSLSLLAIALGSQGKNKEAEETHLAAMQACGFSEIVGVNYGAFLLSQKRYQEAVDAFDKVLRHNPTSNAALINIQKCEKESPVSLQRAQQV